MAANVAPASARELMEAVLKGDYRHALHMQDRLTPLHAGDLRRARRRRRQICAEHARARAQRNAPAAVAGHRGDRRRDPPRHGARRPAQRLTRGRRSWPPKEKTNDKIVSDNRRARFDYEIGEVFEAGLMLTGAEVKSLRTGKATVAESYAAADRNGEMILYNANIPEYLQANRFNHEPRRPRKLLLHAKEIAKLAKGVEREGMTIVPLRIYFNDKGRAKIAIALGAARSCTTSARPRRCATGAARSRG